MGSNVTEIERLREEVGVLHMEIVRLKRVQRALRIRQTNATERADRYERDYHRLQAEKMERLGLSKVTVHPEDFAT